MAPDQKQDSARSRSDPSDQRILSCRIGTRLGSSVWNEVRSGLASQSCAPTVFPRIRAVPVSEVTTAAGLAVWTPVWHDKAGDRTAGTTTDRHRDEVGGRAWLPVVVSGLGGRGDHPREVIEVALAHTVQNKVEAAYARSDLFERRRLMHDREAYVAGAHRPQPPIVEPAEHELAGTAAP